MIPVSTHVLELPELLELIIIELPIRGIFQAQRISTIWRNLIHDSPAIQRKLFLSPVAPPEVATPAEGVEWFLDPEDTLTYKRCLTVNPCFRQVGEVRTPSDELNRTYRDIWARAEMKVEDKVDVGGERPIRLRIDRCNSGHAMYITQPPCTSARVETSAGLNVRYPTMCNENGLQFKDLVDAVEEMPIHAEDAELIAKGYVRVDLSMEISGTKL